MAFLFWPQYLPTSSKKIKSRKNIGQGQNYKSIVYMPCPMRRAAIPWSSGCMMLEGVDRRRRIYWSPSQVDDVFLWPLALDPEYLDNVGSGLFESSLMTFMACQPRCLPKGNDIVHGKSPLGPACCPTSAGHETAGSCCLVGIATEHISKRGQFGDGIVSVLVAVTECLQEAI